MTPLLETLTGAHGKLTALLTWIAAARLALKPFNLFLLAWFHRIVTKLQDHPDPFIAELAARVLQNRAYRLFAFLLDTAISIKLPTINPIPPIPPITQNQNQNQNQPTPDPMKKILPILLLTFLAFLPSARAQTNATFTPPPPADQGSFFNTAMSYFSSFNTNIAWDTRGEFAAGVDSIQGNGNNLANSLRLSYEAWQPSPATALSVESVTRNGGVAGSIISQQGGIALGFKVFDAKLSAYAHGGYDFATANRDRLYAEVGLRATKKMTRYTYAGVSLGQQLPRNAQVYSAFIGFTF